MTEKQYITNKVSSNFFFNHDSEKHNIQSLSFLNSKKMKNLLTHFASTLSTIVILTVSILSNPSYGASNWQFQSNSNNCVYSHEYNAIMKTLLTPVTANVMMPCPGNISIDLASGECGAVVDYEFLFTNSAGAPVTVNPNSSSIINSTVYCAQGPTTYRRTFEHEGLTDFKITNINIGVYESYNSPTVVVNFRETTGELIGSVSRNAPALVQSMWNFALLPTENIIIPAESSYIMEIVTNVPVVSVFKIGRNTGGNASGFSEATFTSVQCVSTPFNNEIATGTMGTPNSIVFGLTGTPQALRIVNVSAGIASTYNSGDVFPDSTFNMSYNIYFGDGSPTQTCNFTIDVNGYDNDNDNGISPIACHDLVYVSVGEGCEVEITAGMILQGSEYSCYEDYTIQVFNSNGLPLGSTIGEAHLGKKLKVTVTAPDGNSCWGEIIVEDKTPPVLVCNDVYTTCSNNLNPGGLMNNRFSVTSTILFPDISETVGQIVRFDTLNMPGAVINDLNVVISISHPSLSDLSATITSPEGVTVPLFSSVSCDGNKLTTIIDDEAATSIPECELGTDNAIGSFRPLTSLSIFDGRPMSGVWQVRVFDNVSGQVGKINSVDLVFDQTGATIPFPTDQEIEWEYADPGNPNVFVVDGLDECGLAELSYDDTVVDQPCASKYAQIITRCWSGFDEYDNIIAPCCQTIYVIRNGISTIEWPLNYDGTPGNYPALSCDVYGDWIPPVDSTGTATGDFCSNVQLAAPEDVIIDICPASYKILRTHKVIEWCSGTVLVHIQIIKVHDIEGPQLEQHRDTTIRTNANDCFATFRAPTPILEFDCSGIKSLQLSYALDNFDNEIPLVYTVTGVNQATRTIQNLPVGYSYVKWTATDSCGNSSEMEYEVLVEDKIAPNVVCDQFTTASITGLNGGKAIVDAFTFDDGSNDNCGILRYEARRRVAGCGVLGGDNAPFTPTVEFCCDEAGKTIMVELRVTDVWNNSNTCMVSVRIVDKLPPFITNCPKDITLDCQADFKDLSVTGTAIAVDNCEVVSLKYADVVNINNCGVGRVTRTWTATDRDSLRHSCVQIITLVDKRPFVGERDITWPSDYTTPTCALSLHPDSLVAPFNRPKVVDDNCSLVAMHYKDTRFDVVDDACVKILREWTVIDWCTYNDASPVLGQGWYTHIQILKIQDNQKPVFDAVCEDIVIASYGPCRDSVNILKTATDDCRIAEFALEWKYEIFRAGELLPFETKKSDRIKTVLADGKYRVRWTVEDKCGNVAVCSHNLEVKDLKKPTPICFSSLATAVMTTDGTVEIWAEDYDKGSFDNCTPQKDLYMTFNRAKPNALLLKSLHYFKEDGILTLPSEYLAGRSQKWDPVKRTSAMIFSCDDIIGGIQSDVELEISVMDSVGNQDYCTITLSLQDNFDVCPNTTVNFASVSGRVATINNQVLSDSDVKLTSANGEHSKTTKTNASGQFSLSSVVPNLDYTLSIANDKDHLNGVSTLDLVFIQRHILGLASFTEPRKIIASDIDNNEKVTAADLVALRKNILGISVDFPNGQKSYRFLNKSHVFVNPTIPFPFGEIYEYSNLNGQKVNQDFIPIKIGDVNDSATYSAQDINTGSRTASYLDLHTDEEMISAHKEYVLPIYASSDTKLVGIQGTINFDPNHLSIDNVSSGSLNVNSANFGMHIASKGLVTFSINETEAVSVQTGKPLFYIHVTSDREINAQDAITVTSDVTVASAYDAAYQTKSLRWTRANTATDFDLAQNTPNPFSANTTITFTLPTKSDITLNITDVNGRVIREWSGNYPAGQNNIVLNRDELPQSGIYMYHLTSEGRKLTKKMIVIDNR